MARNKVKVSLLGQMVVPIKEISMRIIYMEEEYIAGLMEEYIMVHGSVTKCMGMEYLHGLMEENMKVNMLMIKNKERECLSGQMVGDMWVGG